MAYPTTTAASDVWSLRDVYKAEAGANWPFLTGGLVQGLNYFLHDSSSVYSANDHPTDSSEMDAFFDTNQSPLTQSGQFFEEINWADDGSSGAGGATLSQPPYIPGGTFAWKVEGFIIPDETGLYTFGVDSDDAADVFVNNSLVAHYYGSHGFSGNWTSDSLRLAGTINLTAGQSYPFKARIENGSGGYGIQVGWQKPSQSSIELIPSQYYFYNPA